MTAHRCGSWAKRIRGHLYYFGPVSKPDVALTRLQKDGPDLFAGRTPRPDDAGGGAMVADVCNWFLAGRLDLVDSGELRPATWNDYKKHATMICQTLGRTTPAAGIRPDDFARLRRAFARRFCASQLAKAVIIARMIFRWAYDNDKLEAMPKFGSGFRPPDKASRKRSSRQRGGNTIYTADQVLELLTAPLALDGNSVHLRAMIYLGINAGFGQEDCATLPLSAVALDAPGNGVIRYPRPKTEVDRIVTLWPQTADAMRASLAARPAFKDDLFFITKYGNPWVRHGVKRTAGVIDKVVRVDSISLQFNKLRRELGGGTMRVPSFYRLRKTFITEADGCGDAHAVHRIRGHALPGMSDVYVQRVDLDRIKKVTDHVWRWLFSRPWPR
jgi:integrase